MNKYTLITQLHANKGLTTLEASHVKAKINDFADAEEMLIYCVGKYKLNYQDLPEEYKTNAYVVAMSVVNNPEMYEQVKSENINTFRKICRILTLAEKNMIRKAIDAKNSEATK